ncbi:von Willebrand factor type A domain-containing protein [Colletotrichum phormii]|uniref:von Willebrand factor type A domain-containing protein n=1 Tax=Colletotrichum phormii TaxID=359342 RepID=A0AAJ0EEJ7_9PEZI|nr:von Willebrand factor type A domain-containing protein [Colletotrichum phormii]KAK1636099.1 von Willebrand factor type A domain-containing protein [Colletotrichum phormii]
MPRFHIERIPSGIHYTRDSTSQFHSEETTSHVPPQTLIFTPSAGVDRRLRDGGKSATSLPAPPIFETASNHERSAFPASHTHVFNLASAPTGLPPVAKHQPSHETVGNGLSHQPLDGVNTNLVGDCSGAFHQPQIPPEPALYAESDTPNDCLPLLNVDIQVAVDGTVARTKLFQRFSNPSKQQIPEARYTFPLYDGSAVIAFSCTIGDERELIGTVQEKTKAAKEFKKAVEKQQTAALLEEHTPEIFETIIGNVPAETDVVIQIEYVCETTAIVLDDGKDVLEVIIPMSIAPRYGDMDYHGLQKKPDSDGLLIEVRIEDGGRIKQVHCNHRADVVKDAPMDVVKVTSLSDLDNNVGEVRATASPVPTYTVVKYSTETAIMDEDFIVSIESSLEYPIRSRATLSPPNEDGLAALMINLKPAEMFEDAGRLESFDGEIIFLLDRSDSMHCYTTRNKRTKMSTLRESMPLSLASLPTTCHFNIVSFGHNAEFLWERSQPYNQNTLDDARSYVRGLEANLGGTELLHALRKVVESRRHTESSTQIVIVTDGEVAPEEVLTFVWETRQKLGDSIRFFALGIGERVPHRIINRIGEFGGGYGEVIDIDANPEWTDRLSLMLTYGLMPKTWTCKVDLGPGFARQDLYTDAFMDKHIETEIRDSRAASFVQAPFPTPCLHPFAFLSVFLLLDLRSRAAPTKVTLRAASHGGDIELKHELNIDTTSNDTSTVQHLAVRASLLDLEAQLSRRVASRIQEDTAKMNAVLLGNKFKVTSRWTSFVALQGSDNVVDEIELYKAEFVQGAAKEFLGSMSSAKHQPTGNMPT